MFAPRRSGAAQVAAAHIGGVEAGVAQVAVAEVGAGQLRALKAGVAQVQAAQVCVLQVEGGVLMIAREGVQRLDAAPYQRQMLCVSHLLSIMDETGRNRKS